MNFQTAVTTCVTQKYAQFKGRGSRSEYWWFMLAYVVGALLIGLIGVGFLSMIYGLALIVPAAAAGFRRLQDMGKPGWYIFIAIGLSLLMSFVAPAPPSIEPGQMPSMTGIGFLSVLGLVQLVVGIVFLWWLTRPSDPDTNAYGPPPPS